MCVMRAIMYHYVRPVPEELPFFRYLHVDDFARQIDWLMQNHRLVSRDELFAARETGTVPEGIVLTFDDGLSDHFDYVFPILKSRGLFGLFYICTSPYVTCKVLDVHRIHLLLGCLGGQEALNRLSRHLKDEMIFHGDLQAFREATYKHQTNDSATTLFKRTLNYLISYEFRENVIDALFDEAFGNQRELVESFYLTPDQIREMDREGMVIGSHGVNHYVFSKLPGETQRQEIFESFAFLEGLVGRPMTTFCHPYGGPHTYTRDTEALLEEVGSVVSFAVDPRDITAADFRESPHALPRYDCNMFPHGKASFGPDRPRQAA